MGIFPSLPCSFLCCFEDSEVKDPWKDPCRHLPVRFGSSIFCGSCNSNALCFDPDCGDCGRSARCAARFGNGHKMALA